jgi:hypothetical protein
MIRSPRRLAAALPLQVAAGSGTPESLKETLSRLGEPSLEPKPKLRTSKRLWG